MNRDPIGEQGGLNLYTAFQNDGINIVDRNGLDNWGSAALHQAGQNSPSIHIVGVYPIPEWEREINPKVQRQRRRWHFIRQEICVSYCLCSKSEVESIVTQANMTLSEFNPNNRAELFMGKDETAGFDATGFGIAMDYLPPNSDAHGVTLRGGGPGYDQEAITNRRHALIGMRRWGHYFGDNGGCVEGYGDEQLVIWTEGMEAGNGPFNRFAVGLGHDIAEQIWDDYITAVANLVARRCGGAIGAPRTTANTRMLRQMHPWLQ